MWYLHGPDRKTPYEDTLRTLALSGRPLRCKMNDYLQSWENRPQDIKALCDAGTVPIMKDMDDDKEIEIPYIMGQVAGSITKIQQAGQIVEERVAEALEQLKIGTSYISDRSRL